MKRDQAIRLDGMILGVVGNLDCILHYCKNNINDDSDYDKIKHSIAESMSALFDISSNLYKQHSDILPNELIPSESNKS